MKMIRLFRRELAAEASDWVRDGLVSSQQAEAILARYGTHLPTGDERSLGYHLLLAFSAFFMGLSIIVLVSANWEEIPRAVRMLGLIALTAATNAAGVFAIKQGRDAAGQIWLFLGSLFYGASIMLIAQIYHLGEHFPDGIFWWAMGIFPVALVTGSVPIMLWTGMLSVLWMWVEAQVGFFPSAYPIFLAGMFWFVFKQRRSTVIFLLAVIGVMFWLELLLAWWRGGLYRFDGSVIHILFSGCLLLVAHTLFRVMELGKNQPDFANYGFVARLWVIRSGLFALLVLGFHEPWEELLRNPWETGASIAMLAVTLCVQGALVFWSVRRQLGQISLFDALKIHASSGVFYILFAVAAMLVSSPHDSFEETSILLQILSNLVAVLAGIWLILRALQETLTHYFYTGIMMLILTALFRYFDLVGDYIGGAMLFFVCAALLFGAARLWRRRTVRGGVR